MLMGLESFSYRMEISLGLMDIFSYIRRAHSLGFDGVQVNVVGPNWNHLGGDDPERLHDVRTLIDELGMYVEIDTAGTEPEHLYAALRICAAVGADVLRTYASFGGDLVQELKQASTNLRKALPMCADLGVRIALENHEYETAQQILDVVYEVGNEYVGVLVDVGNSMMVWEDPVEAVRMMAPYAVSSHFKDHVVILDRGKPLVVGVPQGEGNIDSVKCFQILASSPLKRINVEVCYGYRAPFRRLETHGAGGKLGEGAFRLKEPPFDPAVIAPRSDQTPTPDREDILALHEQAVQMTTAFMKELNEQYG